MKLSQTKMVRLGLMLAGVFALYVLFTSYSSSKGALLDKAEELGGLGTPGPLSEQGPSMGSPHAVGGNAASVQGMQRRTPASQQTYSQTSLTSSELLPKGEIGASLPPAPPVAPPPLKGQNFLQAGYHSNINVVGIAQTNRNPSYDIRTETPNPQAKVGPFLNTTIDPDPFKATHAQDGLSS